MIKLEYALLALGCLVSGATGAGVIALYRFKTGLVDSPTGRSSHRVPTPKGAGIGIVFAFLLFNWFSGISFMFWFPTTVIAFMGLYVDRFGLAPKFRLLIQFTAAIAFLMGMGVSEAGSFSFLIVPLWAVFIVGTSNFYNFMDGINGIAGITGIIAFSLIAVFAYCTKMTLPFIILPICISLSCVGFLPFNIPKAKAFMGDVGSYFLGFTFASLVFLFSNNLIDFICLASFLFPFYADELTTMAVRIRDGKNLTQAHRRHLYQLLANEGKIAHWKISLGYGMLQSIVGVTALLIKSYGCFTLISFLLLCFLGYIWASFHVRSQLERRGIREFIIGNTGRSFHS